MHYWICHVVFLLLTAPKVATLRKVGDTPTPPAWRRWICRSVRGWISGTSFVAMSREVAAPTSVGKSSPHLGLATRASYARLRLRWVVCVRYADNVCSVTGQRSRDDRA